MAGMENDVYKLKGIGPKYTKMLESVDVDSIKELSHRVPAHLFETIEAKHAEVIGFSMKKLETWVHEAKAFKG